MEGNITCSWGACIGDGVHVIVGVGDGVHFNIGIGDGVDDDVGDGVCDGVDSVFY